MGDLIPAFAAGLTDSVNPCALATSVLFIIFLSVFGVTEKYIRVGGITFIIAFFLTKLVLILGLFDFALGPLKVQMYLRFGQLLVAVFFIGLGLVHFYDWVTYWRYLDVRRLLIKMPVFLGPRDTAVSAPQIKTGKFVFLTIILSIAAAVLESVWPLILILGATLAVVNSPDWSARLRSVITKVKIISATALISLGMGLIQIFR